MHRYGRLPASSSWLETVFNTAMLGTTPGHQNATNEILRPLILQAAAAQDDVAALEALGLYENSINCVDYDLRTLLHIAVSRGNSLAVEWLLNNGANVHLRDSLGKTPLVEAVERWIRKRSESSKSIIRLLIEAGSKLPTLCTSLRHAAFSAVRANDISVLQLLYDIGFSLNFTDEEGQGILLVAQIHNRTEVISWIKKYIK
jgi:lysophospholipase